MTYNDKALSRSIDPTVHEMLTHAEALGLETAWDRYEANSGFAAAIATWALAASAPLRKRGRNRGFVGLRLISLSLAD
jgi:hypothetical protein